MGSYGLTTAFMTLRDDKRGKTNLAEAAKIYEREKSKVTASIEEKEGKEEIEKEAAKNSAKKKLDTKTFEFQALKSTVASMKIQIGQLQMAVRELRAQVNAQRKAGDGEQPQPKSSKDTKKEAFRNWVENVLELSEYFDAFVEN